MAGESQKDHWEHVYRGRPLREVPWEEGEPAVELVRLIESGVVEKGPALDIGAGSGNNAVYLAQQGFTCYGIDISPTALSYAREKLAHAGVSCELTLGDVTSLPYPDDSFIFVFDRGCFNSILPEEREVFIRGVHRVLRPGGKYYLNCFSKKDHPDTGIPHSFSPEDIRRYFESLFNINFLKEVPQNRRGIIHHYLSVLMKKV